jgi:hypothetical protein
MKIKYNSFGLASGLNSAMKLQWAGLCFCWSSVRLAGAFDAIKSCVVCVSIVDTLTVKAFAMGQCVPDVACQGRMLILLMYD